MSVPGQLKMPVYHHHSPSGEFSLQFPQLILHSLEQDYREKIGETLAEKQVQPPHFHKEQKAS